MRTHLLLLAAGLWLTFIAILALCAVMDWHPRLPVLGVIEPRSWPAGAWIWNGLTLAIPLLGLWGLGLWGLAALAITWPWTVAGVLVLVALAAGGLWLIAVIARGLT